MLELEDTHQYKVALANESEQGPSHLHRLGTFRIADEQHDWNVSNSFLFVNTFRI